MKPTIAAAAQEPGSSRSLARASSYQRAGGNDWTSIFDPRWTMTVCEPAGSGARGAGGNTNFGSATGGSGGATFRKMTGTSGGTRATSLASGVQQSPAQTQN